MIKIDPDLKAIMSPQPIPEMPGCSFHCSFRDLGDIESATGLHGCTALIAALLRAETAVVEAAAARIVKNPDMSRFAGDIGEIPLPVITLAQRLADAVHRRGWGQPLVLEGEGVGE